MLDLRRINPDNYKQYLYNKVSVFVSYAYIKERPRLKLDSYPVIRMFYLDGQELYYKPDVKKYYFSFTKIKKLLDLIVKRGKKFVSLSNSYQKDYSSYSWRNLMSLFKKYHKIWGEYIRVIDTVVLCAENYEKKLRERMDKNFFSDNGFDKLTQALKFTFHQKRYRDLCLLKQGKITKDKFKEKWKWSEMHVFQYYPVDDNWIEEQLKNIENPKEEIKKLNLIHKVAKKNYGIAYQKLNNEDKKTASLLQDFIYIRDYRFELVLRGGYSGMILHNEIASRLGLSYQDVIYMTPEEVLNKKIPKNLQKRKKSYVYYDDEIYVGFMVNKFKSKFNKINKKEGLRGKGVSPGLIKKRAKVIFDKKDLTKLKSGDIIVTVMTTPDFLSSLNNVSAIITEIGGFTCHTAIVSREFNIPCIVGVKNATKLIKDDDLLEVNATEGVVKILNKK